MDLYVNICQFNDIWYTLPRYAFPCLLPDPFQFAATLDHVPLRQNTDCVRVGNAIITQRLINFYEI